MTTLNLTIHPATAEQIAAGVVDMPEGDSWTAQFRVGLLIENLPTYDFLRQRAAQLARTACAIAAGMTPVPDRAMIGSGPPAMLPLLESELMRAGLRPVYAFTRREAVEERQADGSVVKRAVFRHLGFVGPYAPPVAQAVAEMEAHRHG
jgi:hypothetical protein